MKGLAKAWPAPLAVTVTPRTFGKVCGAPMAAPMILRKGTPFSGLAEIVRVLRVVEIGVDGLGDGVLQVGGG